MHSSDAEKYVHGEMEGEELREFERRLSHDADLQTEVAQIRDLIRDLGQLRLSASIRKAQLYNKRLKIIKWGVLVAAMGLGLLYFSKSYFAQDPTLSPDHAIPIPEGGGNPESLMTVDSLKKESGEPRGDSLLEERTAPQRELPVFAWQDPHAAREMADYYFLTPEEFAFVRGEGAESLLDSAKMQFNAEDYHNALLYLQQLKSTGHEALFFQALCYFRLGRYPEANASFLQAIDQTSDPEKTMELEWYGFLNALACGRPCRRGFGQLSQSILSQPKHEFHSQVQSILQKKLDSR